jgi:hypothetical protein
LVTDWLLGGDPAVAWQAERDLLGRDGTGRRTAVATTGWGAELLSRRGPDGLWDGGLYLPKWTSTFYTLQTLALLGLPGDQPDAVSGTRILLDRGVGDDGGVRLWTSSVADPCVAGMLLRTAAAFGHARDERCERVTAFLLGRQLADGGWNCSVPRHRSVHSSFHSTLSVIEGLSSLPPSPAATEAVDAGRDFLLRHRLYRSHTTGEIADPRLLTCAFPRYWHYDVLRALEHFAASGVAPNERMSDAVAHLRSVRDASGRWRMGRRYPGRSWLVLEPGGRPSRLITLAALRVLRWWGSAPAVSG